MNPQQVSSLLALVHPMLRPWVWLQIFVLRRWVDHHQRAVFIVLDRHTGRVYIRFIADAPASAKTYSYIAPSIPAWERPSSHAHLIELVIPETAKPIAANPAPRCIKTHRTPSIGWDPWRHRPATQFSP